MDIVQKNVGSKDFFIALGIICLVILMAGMWLLDLSVTAMFVGNIILTNGFWTLNPDKAYHIGMYIIIFSGVLSSSGVIYLASRYWRVE